MSKTNHVQVPPALLTQAPQPQPQLNEDQRAAVRMAIWFAQTYASLLTLAEIECVLFGLFERMKTLTRNDGKPLTLVEQTAKRAGELARTSLWPSEAPVVPAGCVQRVEITTNMVLFMPVADSLTFAEVVVQIMAQIDKPGRERYAEWPAKVRLCLQQAAPLVIPG